jgi:hypothetical protein
VDAAGFAALDFGGEPVGVIELGQGAGSLGTLNILSGGKTIFANFFSGGPMATLRILLGDAGGTGIATALDRARRFFGN